MIDFETTAVLIKDTDTWHQYDLVVSDRVVNIKKPREKINYFFVN